MANILSTEKRILAVKCLVDGMSIRATARIADISKNTVCKLVADLGAACSLYQSKVFVNLTCKRLQLDEIWSFVGAKEKNASADKKAAGWGDVWTWTAIDAETKLVPCFMVGERTADCARIFVDDLASRLANRVQITTDGLRAYVEAIDRAFAGDVDYAQLIKVYGVESIEGHRKYSPAKVLGVQLGEASGNPDRKHINTSYVERQNLTMRMGMRRFTRLTNAFSKKVANHAAAIALHFMYYNFARVHQTLRVSPAMAAGVADKLWDVADIVALLDKPE
ncbi:DDE-type integrase/transposase/recombinase [Candidatus Sumerlaeota bacterium]|nr:DDE-type integrase/transposase/recombinase [Candidatus Sumerlaeota bacterium]